MKDLSDKKESDYYGLIKTKLEEFIKINFNIIFHLEITANKNFSNKLKAEISPRGERDIVYNLRFRLS